MSDMNNEKIKRSGLDMDLSPLLLKLAKSAIVNQPLDLNRHFSEVLTAELDHRTLSDIQLCEYITSQDIRNGEFHSPPRDPCADNEHRSTSMKSLSHVDLFKSKADLKTLESRPSNGNASTIIATPEPHNGIVELNDNDEASETSIETASIVKNISELVEGERLQEYVLYFDTELSKDGSIMSEEKNPQQVTSKRDSEVASDDDIPWPEIPANLEVGSCIMQSDKGTPLFSLNHEPNATKDKASEPEMSMIQTNPFLEYIQDKVHSLTNPFLQSYNTDQTHVALNPFIDSNVNIELHPAKNPFLALNSPCLEDNSPSTQSKVQIVKIFLQGSETKSISQESDSQISICSAYNMSRPVNISSRLSTIAESQAKSSLSDLLKAGNDLQEGSASSLDETMIPSMVGDAIDDMDIEASIIDSSRKGVTTASKVLQQKSVQYSSNQNSVTVTQGQTIDATDVSTTHHMENNSQNTQCTDKSNLTVTFNSKKASDIMWKFERRGMFATKKERRAIDLAVQSESAKFDNLETFPTKSKITGSFETQKITQELKTTHEEIINDREKHSTSDQIQTVCSHGSLLDTADDAQSGRNLTEIEEWVVQRTSSGPKTDSWLSVTAEEHDSLHLLHLDDNNNEQSGVAISVESGDIPELSEHVQDGSESDLLQIDDDQRSSRSAPPPNNHRLYDNASSYSSSYSSDSNRQVSICKGYDKDGRTAEEEKLVEDSFRTGESASLHDISMENFDSVTKDDDFDDDFEDTTSNDQQDNTVALTWSGNIIFPEISPTISANIPSIRGFSLEKQSSSVDTHLYPAELYEQDFQKFRELVDVISKPANAIYTNVLSIGYLDSSYSTEGSMVNLLNKNASASAAEYRPSTDPHEDAAHLSHECSKINSILKLSVRQEESSKAEADIKQQLLGIQVSDEQSYHESPRQTTAQYKSANDVCESDEASCAVVNENTNSLCSSPSGSIAMMRIAQKSSLFSEIPDLTNIINALYRENISSDIATNCANLDAFKVESLAAVAYGTSFERVSQKVGMEDLISDSEQYHDINDKVDNVGLLNENQQTFKLRYLEIDDQLLSWEVVNIICDPDKAITTCEKLLSSLLTLGTEYPFDAYRCYDSIAQGTEIVEIESGLASGKGTLSHKQQSLTEISCESHLEEQDDDAHSINSLTAIHGSSTNLLDADDNEPISAEDHRSSYSLHSHISYLSYDTDSDQYHWTNDDWSSDNNDECYTAAVISSFNDSLHDSLTKELDDIHNMQVQIMDELNKVIGSTSYPIDMDENDEWDMIRSELEVTLVSQTGSMEENSLSATLSNRSIQEPCTAMLPLESIYNLNAENNVITCDNDKTLDEEETGVDKMRHSMHEEAAGLTVDCFTGGVIGGTSVWEMFEENESKKENDVFASYPSPDSPYKPTSLLANAKYADKSIKYSPQYSDITNNTVCIKQNTGWDYNGDRLVGPHIVEENKQHLYFSKLVKETDQTCKKVEEYEFEEDSDVPMLSSDQQCNNCDQTTIFCNAKNEDPSSIVEDSEEDQQDTVMLIARLSHKRGINIPDVHDCDEMTKVMNTTCAEYPLSKFEVKFDCDGGDEIAADCCVDKPDKILESSWNNTQPAVPSGDKILHLLEDIGIGYTCEKEVVNEGERNDEEDEKAIDCSADEPDAPPTSESIDFDDNNNLLITASKKSLGSNMEMVHPEVIFTLHSKNEADSVDVGPSILSSSHSSNSYICIDNGDYPTDVKFDELSHRIDDIEDDDEGSAVSLIDSASRQDLGRNVCDISEGENICLNDRKQNQNFFDDDEYF